MTTTPRFRFSTGEVATSEEAKNFSWESPVPVNQFWDSFEYCTARSFLGNFTDQELKQLPISPDAPDDQSTKLRLLLQIPWDKLGEAEYHVLPNSLYESDYQRWYGFWHGIYTLENELGLPEAEQTVRMLVEKRPDKSNVVPPHMLAEHLVKIGKYKEAEETERPVCAWMDARPHLGKSSPKAINARRIIARALWFQGESRRREAEALVAEIHEIVDGMSGGKFGIYQKEEIRLRLLRVSRFQLVNVFLRAYWEVVHSICPQVGH
ncbi:hypothetical protein F1880_002700 [Penicillium rolfsii]|nr:hypothetical protein F1880_002700 [Penicillium rolfsii]